MKLVWDARTLRVIMSIAIVILLAGGVGLFFLGKDLLTTQAQQASDLATEATQSNEEHNRLTRTKAELERNQHAIERASKIVAESKSYQYQNQITDDVYRLAERAGISIMGINFETASTGAPASAPAAANNSGQAAGQQQSDAAVGSITVPPGVTPTSATITIKGPVAYQNVIRFVYTIEQNLTKMRINSVSLSALREEGKKGISSDAITLEVYIRK